MKLTLATSWSELSDWQKREFSYIILSPALSEGERENPKYILSLLKILVMRKNSLWERFRWHRLVRQVPVSVLLPFLEKLLQQTDLLTFPNISQKLKTPGARMNNCTIKQFSFCDAIFYKLMHLKENKQKREILEKQLVASLYTFKKAPSPLERAGERQFDPLVLPKVAEITDKIDEKTRSQIVFTYRCVRHYIENRYPKIFPKASKSSQENEDKTPTGATRYIPFTKVIHSMAMDERQPLGNLHQCNDTLVYDFFDILQEALLRSE